MFNCDFNTIFMVERTEYNPSTRKDGWNEIDNGEGRITPNTDKTQQFRETNWGKEFWLDVPFDIEIKAGDRVVINSQVYDVNHVTENIDPDGIANYLRVILYKTGSTKKLDE